MTSLSVWILLILGFVTIERIYGVDMSPDLQAGSMEGAVQRPVLFSSTAEVKQYLDTLGKKMRQRYGKRAMLQAFRDLNSRRLEPLLDSQAECNCERLRK